MHWIMADRWSEQVALSTRQSHAEDWYNNVVASGVDGPLEEHGTRIRSSEFYNSLHAVLFPSNSTILPYEAHEGGIAED